MGILDQLADFGSQFADTYFDVGKMMQADDVGRDRAAQEFERARGAKRTEDFNQLLFDAQQQIPDFFNVAADTSYQQNRQRRGVSRRAADMGDMDLDPRFQEAMFGLSPNSPEYRAQLADYLGNRGFAPEALRYADEARSRQVNDALLPLMMSGRLSPEMQRMLGIEGMMETSGVDDQGNPVRADRQLSPNERMILAQMLNGSNPGVQSLSRAAQAAATQRAQLAQRGQQGDAQFLQSLARTNPEFAARLQAIMGGRDPSQIPSALTNPAARLGTTSTRQRTGQPGNRNMYSELSDAVGFEVNDKNAPLVERALVQTQLENAGQQLSPDEMRMALTRKLMDLRLEMADPTGFKKLQEMRKQRSGVPGSDSRVNALLGQATQQQDPMEALAAYLQRQQPSALGRFSLMPGDWVGPVMSNDGGQ